eukprot:1558889-Prymnesium_polylepis.1
MTRPKTFAVSDKMVTMEESGRVCTAIDRRRGEGHFETHTSHGPTYSQREVLGEAQKGGGQNQIGGCLERVPRVTCSRS